MIKELSESPRVLDLGTGSGNILLSILRRFPSMHGVGVDLSCGAVRVAVENANRLELNDHVAFCLADFGHLHDVSR